MEPATEYVRLPDARRSTCRPSRLLRVFVVVLLSASAGAFAMHQYIVRMVDTIPMAYEYHSLPQEGSLASGMPSACKGWEKRCIAVADAAHAQGFTRFFDRSACDEQSQGKVSCAHRRAVWESPSVWMPPQARERSGRLVTDVLVHPLLLVFLPGTGTPPEAVRTLVAAAADMGLHALALSYASSPLAVSHADLWCTRRGPGGNASFASACNRQLHESVLFGAPSAAEGGGLWDLAEAEAVVPLLRENVRRLGWEGMFLTMSGEVDWSRVVVSGHSQGASHAAYLSTRVRVRAAVLFSGPQEGPNCSAWVRDAPQVLRRATFSAHEECGDAPEAGPEQASYCATFSPGSLAKNLRAMGLTPGFLGNESGYVVTGRQPYSRNCQCCTSHERDDEWPDEPPWRVA
jgi:hypothetical protein